MDRTDLAGMTLNERLFVLGLHDDFDAAVRNRDRASLAALLRKAEVADVVWTVDAILEKASARGAQRDG